MARWGKTTDFFLLQLIISQSPNRMLARFIPSATLQSETESIGFLENCKKHFHD